MALLSDKPWDIVIVGGGPAGFFAGIGAAEEVPGLKVLILEKARRSLGKVLISGGGRCNVTHAEFDPARLIQNYPRGARALLGPFNKFQPADTIRWFENHQVELKTEPDGRIFPVSNTSRTIVEALDKAAQQAGIKVQTLTEVLNLENLTEDSKGAARFQIQVNSRGPDRNNHSAAEYTARCVLLASGGERGGFDLAKGLGHTIITPVPSLFTFQIDDQRLSGLSGLSVPQAGLILRDPSQIRKRIEKKLSPQVGPLLITHWGLSGPVVLRLSAWGARWLAERNYQAELIINWLYPMTAEEVVSSLQVFRQQENQARKRAGSFSPFPGIPSRLYERLAVAAGITPDQNWADLPKVTMHRLANELSSGVYFINGKGVFKEEFVTAGGVNLDEVNFTTMESHRNPGLFFAGEILNIDGLTGGFNFQNAWTTGWIAGKGMLNRLAENNTRKAE